MMKKIMAVLVCVFLTGCDLAPVSEALSKTSEALTVAEENLRPVAQESWRAYSNRHPVIRESVGLDGRVIKMISPQFPPEWYFGSKRITTPIPKPTPTPIPKPTPRPIPKPERFADSENSYLFDDIWCEPSELVNNAYVDVYGIYVDTMDELVDETAECPGFEDGEDWDYYGKIPDSCF